MEQALTRTGAANDSINTFYVPLQFWFEHTGLTLPLIALQYHEVKINLTFAVQTAISIQANNNWELYINTKFMGRLHLP